MKHEDDVVKRGNLLFEKGVDKEKIQQLNNEESGKKVSTKVSSKGKVVVEKTDSKNTPVKRPKPVEAKEPVERIPSETRVGDKIREEARASARQETELEEQTKKIKSEERKVKKIEKQNLKETRGKLVDTLSMAKDKKLQDVIAKGDSIPLKKIPSNLPDIIRSGGVETLRNIARTSGNPEFISAVESTIASHQAELSGQANQKAITSGTKAITSGSLKEAIPNAEGLKYSRGAGFGNKAIPMGASSFTEAASAVSKASLGSRLLSVVKSLPKALGTYSTLGFLAITAAELAAGYADKKGSSMLDKAYKDATAPPDEKTLNYYREKQGFGKNKKSEQVNPVATLTQEYNKYLTDMAAQVKQSEDGANEAIKKYKSTMGSLLNTGIMGQIMSSISEAPDPHEIESLMLQSVRTLPREVYDASIGSVMKGYYVAKKAGIPITQMTPQALMGFAEIGKQVTTGSEQFDNMVERQFKAVSNQYNYDVKPHLDRTLEQMKELNRLKTEVMRDRMMLEKQMIRETSAQEMAKMKNQIPTFGNKGAE